jgi:hypothetical protein
MTTAFNLLAEIRRVGGDVRMVGPDRLKLSAPAALLPKLAEQSPPGEAATSPGAFRGRGLARPLPRGAAGLGRVNRMG